MIRKKNILEVDLGRIEFAPIRSDVPEDERHEENTDIEESIYRSIYKWINLEEQPATHVVVALRDAMLHPVYSRFFVGPKPNVVLFRGFSVNRSTLSRWLGDIDVGAVKEGRGVAAGHWTFRPVNPGAAFTSYTPDLDTALTFSSRGKDEYKVVVEAAINENRGAFLDIYEMTRRINDSYHFDEDLMEFEREVIGIGPINVRKISWMIRGTDHYDS